MKKGVIVLLLGVIIFVVGCASYQPACQGDNCYGGHPLILNQNNQCANHYIVPDGDVCLHKNSCNLNPKDSQGNSYFPNGTTTINAGWLPNDPNLCVFFMFFK